MTECSLCRIVEKNSKKSVLNKVIVEWNNFILVPSIGPLDIGHFLIVSKSHACGLATMSKEQINEFFNFANFLKSKSTSSNLLFFEHGSYENDNAGSCIDHTHIHVIPSYSEYFSALDGTLEIVNKNFTIEQFYEIDFPYIMSFNSKNQSRIYKAYNVHSQMMRKAICSKSNLNNWDWKANKNVQLIKNGIDFWKDTLNVIVN